jgi:hypothetical protein
VAQKFAFQLQNDLGDKPVQASKMIGVSLLTSPHLSRGNSVCEDVDELHSLEGASDDSFPFQCIKLRVHMCHSRGISVCEDVDEFHSLEGASDDSFPFQCIKLRVHMCHRRGISVCVRLMMNFTFWREPAMTHETILFSSSFGCICAPATGFLCA